MSKDKSPFQIREEKGSYKLYAFMPYYPKNKYSDKDLTSEEGKFRKLVWDFKDGLLSKQFGEVVADSLTYILPEDKIAGSLFCIIPASTKIKTQKRFYSFCNVVSEKSGVINGYNYIQNSVDHDAGHISGEKQNILEFIKIADNVLSENVILFDDITTSGSNFLNLARKLTSMGANRVTGVFLGKTSYKDTFSSFEEL